MDQYKVFTKFCGKVCENVFRKQKSAYQFEQRCVKGWEKPFAMNGKPITRMIKKDGSDTWEQYTVIGNQLVTVSELQELLKLLQNEAQKLQ
jgi:F0F1-type ATP synthase gamma subunit